MRLHRLRNDQLYHYYLGDPLEVILLHADGAGERIIVGPDLHGGQHVQLRIPGHTFHAARLIGQGRWFLGGSTFRRMLKSAISTRWPQNIQLLPSSSTPSKRRYVLAASRRCQKICQSALDWRKLTPHVRAMPPMDL
ncbi:MAG TPA: cupin domain-containing protein [Methylocella sp.]|nr:cupin domain-containing protein [Methylocella sp.]